MRSKCRILYRHQLLLTFPLRLLVTSPLTADFNQTYGALHAMVTPSAPGGYFPTPLGGTPTCDEFLVYNKNHCLPRFWIELAIALSPSVAAASKVSTLPAGAMDALQMQVHLTVITV